MIPLKTFFKFFEIFVLFYVYWFLHAYWLFNVCAYIFVNIVSVMELRHKYPKPVQLLISWAFFCGATFGLVYWQIAIIYYEEYLFYGNSIFTNLSETQIPEAGFIETCPIKKQEEETNNERDWQSQILFVTIAVIYYLVFNDIDT